MLLVSKENQNLRDQAWDVAADLLVRHVQSTQTQAFQAPDAHQASLSEVLTELSQDSPVIRADSDAALKALSEGNEMIRTLARAAGAFIEVAILESDLDDEAGGNHG